MNRPRERFDLPRRTAAMAGAILLGLLLPSILWAAGAPADLGDFLARIRSDDGATRRAAWESAGPFGAKAVGPLVKILAGDDKDKAKAAGFALDRITHHACRPGPRRPSSGPSRPRSSKP